MTDRLGPLARFRPPVTPVLVVRRAALEANLAAMQSFCDAAGVSLRAHGKMHKCSRLGLRQVELGAVGLCCQTIGEAETYVAAGIADVLITSPPAAWAADRIAALARAGAKVAVVADSRAQIDHLAAAARTAGADVGLVVDVDLGLHRTGAYPSGVLDLARRADAAEGLTFRGLQAYLGHLQHLADLPAREAGSVAAQVVLRALVGDLNAAGLAPEIISGGGTGTYASDIASGVFTELQAGSYAFMDVEYEDCGAPDGGAWPFAPALFLAASVVSANHKSHVTCDLGLKAHSVDGPLARVEGGAAPGSRWRPMGDEHGAIFHPEMTGLLRQIGAGGVSPAQAIDTLDADAAVPWPSDSPGAGEIVWLQPGHCDPTVNLHDALYVVSEDGSSEVWRIDARRVTA